VLFRIKHLGIADRDRPVRGLSGEFSFDSSERGRLVGEGHHRRTSIDTNVAKRDEDSAARISSNVPAPEITFREQQGNRRHRGHLQLHGDLTIRG